MTGGIEASEAYLRQLHEQTVDKQILIEKLKEMTQDKQGNQIIEKELEEASVAYAKASSRELVQMMYLRLPPELRDMIYKYLYFEEAQIPIGKWHFSTYTESPGSNIVDEDLPFLIPDGAIKEDHRIHPPSHILLPNNRILDPAYVGHDLARELSKLYYSSNEFSICARDGAISSLLFKDAAYNFTRDGKSAVRPLGILPMDYVRRLQIRIKCERYDGELGIRKQAIVEDIFSNLKPFLNRDFASRTPDLSIEFIIMLPLSCCRRNSEDRTKEHKRHLTNVMEAVRLPLYTLKHDVNAEISISHLDDIKSPFPADITKYFALTKEQWEFEKSALSALEVEYSPADYFIAAPWSETKQGLRHQAMTDVLAQRWGFTFPEGGDGRYIVSQGPYWPTREIGRGVE